MSDSTGYGDRPWRVGRKVGHGSRAATGIYDAHDRLIGIMDTPILASLAVLAVNTLNEPTKAGQDREPDRREDAACDEHEA